MAVEEGTEDDPLRRGLGQKQERSLRAAPLGEAGAAQTHQHFFRLLGTVSKSDNVFIPLVRKVNTFLIRTNHCTGWFCLLMPAGVVMPSSIRKDARTLLTGLV